MNTQKRYQIIVFNRLVIMALTISGLVMDGFQPSDLVFIAASFIWLWMADCVRLEAHWLQKTQWLQKSHWCKEYFATYKQKKYASYQSA